MIRPAQADLKIGIIGQGFVGRAAKATFTPHYPVFTYDKYNPETSTHLSVNDVATISNICFVCVPTPMNPDGSCNTFIVEGVVKEISHANKDIIIVIKSTLPPNSTKLLQKKYHSLIVFNPEFLLERNAEEDFRNTTRVILGGPRKATTILKRFYSKVFPKAHVIKTDSTIAELVKYLTNSFLSVKVSFANEIYSICNGLDADYDKVIEYALWDDRLGLSHWGVPGPDGHYGFGGSCFPKDLNAVRTLAKELSLNIPTIEGAWETNLRVRPEKDWEDLKGRAIS
tara:strand:- start:275 stop:1126 length:852 start_codon:yes stop_codon:yes gene_type:complete